MVQYFIKILKSSVIILHCCCAQEMGGAVVYFSNIENFQQNGISGVAGMSFQKRNLLIGKNGAGKTRFLKSLVGTLKQQESTQYSVVLLDFSTFHLSSNTDSQGKETTKDDVYSILFGGDVIEFSDFLQLFDEDNENLFADIVTMLYQMRWQKGRGTVSEGLDKINELLLKIVNIQIKIEEGDEHKVVLQIQDQKGKVVREGLYSSIISELSPGQRLLFYLCFFLYYVQTVTRQLIIVMDEPEIHLHPRALVDFIQWIYQNEKVEGLWVASHSLFLVPLFQFQEVVFFEDGSVKPHNSHMYHHLYDDLIGIQYVDMYEFLKSLDNWQYYHFIVECFCLPVPVSEASSKDEQFQKFLNAIPTDASSFGGRILDYGAGKFRIWECLQMYLHEKKEVQPFSYEAYEPYPDDDSIKALATNGTLPFPLYKTAAELPENAYDVVVMMNVLHEIDVLEWEETFKIISKVLNPKGILLLLEVQTLTYGEQPYGNTGYLILGQQEVQELFSLSDNECNTKLAGEKSECWVIPKTALDQISEKDIEKCIACLANSSKAILEELFSSKVESAKKGNKAQDQAVQLAARKYAFFSQQYINAILALDRLRGTNNIKKTSSFPKRLINEKGESPIEPPMPLDFPGLTKDLNEN